MQLEQNTYVGVRSLPTTQGLLSQGMNLSPQFAQAQSQIYLSGGHEFKEVVQ